MQSYERHTNWILLPSCFQESLALEQIIEVFFCLEAIRRERDRVLILERNCEKNNGSGKQFNSKPWS